MRERREGGWGEREKERRLDQQDVGTTISTLTISIVPCMQNKQFPGIGEYWYSGL